MRLTVYTDYSLRMLMYLAVNREDVSTIADIAGAFGIAKNHLTKVAHQLGRAGLVATSRGKGGGLRLARPAEEIGLGEIIRLCEPDLALVPCFAPVCGSCAVLDACGLRGALYQAQAAFMATLDRFTLAELTSRKDALRGLLGLAAVA